MESRHLRYEAEALNFGRVRLLDHDERYAARRNSSRSPRDSGTAGKTTPSCATRTAASSSTRQGLHARSPGRVLQGARPAQHSARAAGLPRAGAGRFVEAGKDLAAASAEVVFTAQQTLKDAQAFYRDVKARTRAHGRSPDDVKIMPGIFRVVGRTEAEASAKFDQLQNLIHPDVALSILEHRLGVPLRHLPLDGPLPKNIPLTNAAQSRQALLLELAEREGCPSSSSACGWPAARGNWQVVGTPEQVADAMEERFLNEGADVQRHAALSARRARRFHRAGRSRASPARLFRTDYEGRTLREHLGLARPARRHKHHKPAHATRLPRRRREPFLRGEDHLMIDKRSLLEGRGGPRRDGPDRDPIRACPG